MFDFERLAGEDYEFMGSRNEVWTVWDACILLTSFEMEASSAFESHELEKYERIVLHKERTGSEKIFNETFEKWRAFIKKALFSSQLQYANIGDPRVSQCKETEGRKYYTANSAVLRDDLLNLLVECRDSEDISLDLNLLGKFLDGKGSAPKRYGEKPARTLESRVTSKHKVKKNPKQSTRGKAGAESRWSEARATKEVIKKYALKVDEKGCTCNHSQLATEIHENAIDDNGNALMGRSEMSLDVVMETVKDLFKKNGIKRVKGVDVFKDETACKVHNPEEYMYQRKKSS